jgi:hypothetical protein
VLGLRDVLDDPDLLAPEWERKGALAVLPLYRWSAGSTSPWKPAGSLSTRKRSGSKRSATWRIRVLAPEWERKGALAVLPLYDSLWVYGLEAIYAPLDALALPFGRQQVRIVEDVAQAQHQPAAAGLEPVERWQE